MALIIGQEYYWLSPSDYDWLKENYTDGSDLISNFTQGPDGYYYADPDDIDGDEFDFLLENDIAFTTYYSKSTQPGAGM